MVTVNVGVGGTV